MEHIQELPTMRPAPKSHFTAPLDYVLGETRSVRLLRTLATLGGQVGASFLSERSGLSRSSTHYGLGRLQQEGLVEIAGSGTTRVYALNRQHFLADALVALFDAEYQRVVAAKRAMRDAVVAHMPPIHAAWVYGSVARGSDRVDSDLDLALVVDAEDTHEPLEAFRAEMDRIGEQYRLTISILAFTPTEYLELPQVNAGLWANLNQDASTVAGVSPEILALQLRTALRPTSARGARRARRPAVEAAHG